MAITKSSRLFLERLGLLATSRSPVPTVDPAAWKQHRQGTRPLTDLISNGAPAPDRPVTAEPWPHGQDCST